MPGDKTTERMQGKMTRNLMISEPRAESVLVGITGRNDYLVTRYKIIF
jgi:hypothetical protein